MNKHHYTPIVRDHRLTWAKGVFRWNFVIVQDNVLPHVARGMVEFLDQDCVEVMDCYKQDICHKTPYILDTNYDIPVSYQSVCSFTVLNYECGA